MHHMPVAAMCQQIPTDCEPFAGEAARHSWHPDYVPTLLLRNKKSKKWIKKFGMPGAQLSISGSKVASSD